MRKEDILNTFYGRGKKMIDTQAVPDLIKKIFKKADLELHCFLTLIYLCGIEKNELCSLKIKDTEKLENTYKIDTHAAKKSRYVEIDTDAKNIFETYLKNLKLNPNSSGESFVFPSYNSGYGKKKITKDLANYSSSIKIHKIRSAGIQSHYDRLMKMGSNKNDAINKVSDKFRLSPRAANDQLKGAVKLPGKPKLVGYKKRDMKTLELFDRLTSILNSGKSSELAEISKEFYAHIENYDFSDEEKDNLIKLWENNISRQMPDDQPSISDKKKGDKLDLIEIIRKSSP